MFLGKIISDEGNFSAESRGARFDWKSLLSR